MAAGRLQNTRAADALHLMGRRDSVDEDHMPDGEVLEGGVVGGATRVGQSVLRPTGEWTPAVHQLLAHLEMVGFTGAPRVLGFAPDGREILTFIGGDAGSVVYPHALLEEEGVIDWGRFVRRYHDAVASFVPGQGAVWRVGRKRLRAGEIVCHGDLGHWNASWRHGRVVGAIDWDFAEPDSPLRDLATAALGVVPFVDDEQARHRFSEPPDRRRRLSALCDAYESVSPLELLDAAVGYLHTEARRISAFGGERREPWASLLRRGSAEALTKRARWIEMNRAKLVY
jgi:hypothetical protein